MATTWNRATLAFIVLAVAGCSDHTSAPTSPATGNAAQNSSGAFSGLADPDVAIFEVGAANTSTDRQSPCVFDPAIGQFTCPDQSRGGITFTKRFTLYDASGQVQSTFDRATTASIKTETIASGTTSRDGATVTFNRSGVMVASGLGPDATTHTLNGTETGTTVATLTTPDGTTVTTNTAVSDTTTDLVVPVHRGNAEPDYPRSGVRVHDTVVTITRGSQSRTVSTRRQETFDGTSIVQVEITVGGASERCTYDLAAKTGTCGPKVRPPQ